MKTGTYVYDARKWAERQTSQPFGYQLERLYAKILDGWVNPREHDCGRDIEFRDPTDPRKTVGVQVKSNFYRDEVVRFLGSALRAAEHRGRSWTNFCIGEPPQGPLASARVLILRSFECYGAWIDEGLPLRMETLAMFATARNTFPSHTVQRMFLLPSEREI